MRRRHILPAVVLCHATKGSFSDGSPAFFWQGLSSGGRAQHAGHVLCLVRRSRPYPCRTRSSCCRWIQFGTYFVAHHMVVFRSRRAFSCSVCALFASQQRLVVPCRKIDDQIFIETVCVLQIAPGKPFLCSASALLMSRTSHSVPDLL